MNVALLAEGVDRNIPVCKAQLDLGPVALLAEGVDRNLCSKHYKKSCTIVALLAEGVDRNLYLVPVDAALPAVALLAEGVDRNHMGLKAGNPVQVSPSSRRAWIEISRKLWEANNG